MSDRTEINSLKALVNDIIQSFQSDAVCSDMLISSYKSICNDKELSDNEKRYFDDALGGTLGLLDRVRNPQIFNTSNKKAIRLFFCPSSRVTPDAQRDDTMEKEDVFYKEMAVLCPEIFKDTSHFDKLLRLFESGCPTRMTVAYADPFTALYEAGTGIDKEISVFAVPYSELSHPDSDRALMLSCLPKLSLAKKRELLESSYASLLTKRFQQLKGGSRYLDDAPEELYKEITTEKPFFRRDIDPADLLKPLFVLPYGARDKVYIINGLCVNEKEAIRRIRASVVKTYAITDKQNMLSELALIGFDGARFCKNAKEAADYLKSRI